MSLSVSRLVRVSVNLSPVAAARRGFGTLLIAGDSNVIDGLERIRSYTTIESVAEDFDLTDPEYLAATLYFSQVPKPLTLNIARWLRTDTAGILKGATLTVTEQLLATWQAITDGGFKITLDGGAEEEILTLNFSGAASLNAVAALISAEITGGTCTFDGSRFLITSDTTGDGSTVSFLTPPDTGDDISDVLKMTSDLGLPLIPGYDAETPAECVSILANLSSAWYGLQFAASTMPSDSESIDVAALIQAFTVSRIFGITTTSTTVLESTVTTDIATKVRDLGYTRTCVQYSANAYAVASLFGRAFSVNFAANRSTITLMYKQEPGIVAENLTESQATTLQSKRCNVFVSYDNETAIIQYGVMSGPAYFDEIHGLDWLQNAIQTNEYNLLYTGKTKIPQTNAGGNQLVNAVAEACDAAVSNGLVAPGTWNADGFGQLSRGDYLKAGYYIYIQPMELQSQADREARKAPPIQVAVKLAGAVHEIDVLVDVNR